MTPDAVTQRRKVSILMVCHLPPPVHGASMVGQAIVQSRLLNDAMDLRVIPISGGDLQSLGSFDARKFVRTIVLMFRVAGALIGNRPDLIYLTPSIDGFGFLRDAGISILARLVGVPRTLHIHMRGINERYRKGGWRRPLYRALFGGADIIHLDASLYTDVDSLVPADRFHAVSNGVADPRSSRPVPKRADRADAPLILYLSNLQAEKGATDLLAASEQLRARGVAHRLIFAGSPREPEVVAAIQAAEQQTGGQVRFLGPIYGDDKGELLASADIFAFPSRYRYECQPLSLIEAMGHGLPIVSTDAGASGELVRGGSCPPAGEVVPQGDAIALAGALEMLLVNMHARRAMAAGARARFEQSLTLEAFESRLKEKLLSVLAREGGQG